MFHWYNFTKCLQAKGAYVHYAWWNNLLAPYMEKPLHYAYSVPSYEPMPWHDYWGFFYEQWPLCLTIGGCYPNKALPADDHQFQADARTLLTAIRENNPDAVIILVGHSMGGDAVVRLARNVDVDIDLLAPIDPVGNRTCLPNNEGATVGVLNNYCWGSYNFTRFQATHEDGYVKPYRIGFGEEIGYLYHRWQTEFMPPFDYGCPDWEWLCPLQLHMWNELDPAVISGTVPRDELDLPDRYLFRHPDMPPVGGINQGSVNVQSRIGTRLDSGKDVPVVLSNGGGGFDGHGEINGFRGFLLGDDFYDFAEWLAYILGNPLRLFEFESYALGLEAQGDWPSRDDPTDPERVRRINILKAWEDDPQYLYKQGYEPWNPGLCMVSRDLCNILDEIVPTNQPPVADAGPDQTVPADDECMGRVTLDGTASTDPEGEALTYTWTWNDGADEATGPDPIIELPLGSHEITLVVNDGQTDSDPDTVVIAVVDVTPPVIELVGSAEMVLECVVDTWEDPGAFATDNCDPDVAVSVGGDTVDPAVPGTYTITYDAVDASGNIASQVIRTVVVQDTLPPTFESVTADPAALWPPNHSMVPIQLAVAVHDFCDATPDIMLIDVTSDEPDDAQGGGDGNTTGDIQGADIGTEDYDILLRAERQGGGDGRVYTIIYSATDDSGNSAGSGAIVTVRHDSNERPVPKLPQRGKIME